MTSFKFSSLWAGICATILSLLGISCSNEEEVLMYGTPTAEFEVKGIVTTEKDEAPVPDAIIKVTENISAEVGESAYQEEVFFRTVTDDFGRYGATDIIFPMKTVKVICIPPTAALQPDTVVVELEYVKDKNDGSGWYRGTAKAEVNFKLKEKPTEQ
ncbi:MAG: radical SAM-associated putative lipoprotein [Muribaculaceae bacterium]|nr:radical SAM-associated putative lipoprotein [Muribaculaceae bacterium]